MTTTHVQLGPTRIWVDCVGLELLAGVLLFAAVYLLWCSWVKAQRGADSTVAAGMYRLAAARGDLQTLACLHAATSLNPDDAAISGFTALHAAVVLDQQGED